MTELNLRRNGIESVDGLNALPALQRVFLSHNLISSLADVQCLFSVNYLIELSLDGNPLAELDPTSYRQSIIVRIPGLRHLDLKRVSEEERIEAQQSQSAAIGPLSVLPLSGNDLIDVATTGDSSSCYL